MKLGGHRERRPVIKAGATLRESELAPAFDIRRELSDQFLQSWRAEIVQTFIHGELREGSRGVVAANQLREQLEAMPVLDQVFGREILPLGPADQRLAERKIKIGLRDLSRVTQKLQDEEFKWWDAVEDLARYHEASRVQRPRLVGDDVMEFIQKKMPTPHAGLDTHLALLRLRPDKRELIRSWAIRFDRRVEEAYRRRTDPTVSPTFLKMLNEYLLIYPEKRDQFMLDETDRRMTHEQVQKNLRKNGANVMPALFQQAIAFAREAWVDEAGKIQVRLPATKAGHAVELPERPLM